MPDVVTHLYDPEVGVCPDLCSLSDLDAERVLDRLRRTHRPSLKPTYLSRRRATERWLSEQASKVLRRRFKEGPSYFFLGDFSHTEDLSRPAALLLPMSTLPTDGITFTLGDSMNVCERSDARVFSFDEISALFEADEIAPEFGLSDRHGFQPNFIEVQLWDRSELLRSDLRQTQRVPARHLQNIASGIKQPIG